MLSTVRSDVRHFLINFERTVSELEAIIASLLSECILIRCKRPAIVCLSYNTSFFKDRENSLDYKAQDLEY